MYQLIFWLGKYLVMGALPTLEMNRKSQSSKFLHAELILIVKASRSDLLDHLFLMKCCLIIYLVDTIMVPVYTVFYLSFLKFLFLLVRPV